MEDHNGQDGIRITTLRARLGRITQVQLRALVCDKPSVDVNGWETGRRKAPLDQISLRLYPFGVNPEYVLGLSESFCRPGFNESQVCDNVKAALIQTTEAAA